MLPVPIQAQDHETQGLMGSDEDDVSQSLTQSNNPSNTNIGQIVPMEVHSHTSSTQNGGPTHNRDDNDETGAMTRGANNGKSRVSQRDVNLRIRSYLRESDENCRESATLVAIVIIGLIVTGSVIGFLQLGHHDPSAIHKGSHASISHVDGEELPNNLNDWITRKMNSSDYDILEGHIDSQESLGIQPLYRNYLLQTIYEYSFTSAIRVDKNDIIFQHVSMTYGGPWIVPTPPDDDEDADNTQQRRLQNDAAIAENDDLNNIADSDGDSDTEKDVIDPESHIEMISMENGRNDHTFTFGGDGPNSYEDNVNQWYCYIFEFANADKLTTKQELWRDYTFKIVTTIDNFDMEGGYDFVRVYVNSVYKKSFTGKLDKPETLTYRIDYEYLNQWNEEDIPSFELCFNVVTDNSVTKRGFDVSTKIEYENPEIVTWDENDNCFIQKPSWRNPSRWDGSCGIGVNIKKITKCDEDKLKNLQVSRSKPGTGGSTDAELEAMKLDQSGLYRGVCKVGEEEKKFCIAKDCGDQDIPMNNKEVKSNPKLKYHFNGHGRIDPSYPDAFDVKRSTNQQIDIDDMIQKIEQMRDDILSEYSDPRILRNPISKHDKMDDSKIRLGIKLARSLILGDTFHAVFTGSSNTAGHDNMFMSTYPMQLQSILRPLWKEIGYKGAAFRVSDRAVGGAIGTDQLAWCIPEITGGNAEKVDVIVWESTMNDAGSGVSRSHTMEEHLRNSLSVYGGTYNNNIPNRPVWHAVIAGSNQNQPTSFDKTKPMYDGYKDLVTQYADFGAGIVEFNPSLGMNPMKASDPDHWSDEHFYVTWHPGPVGHRIYAEIIASFYLDSALTVLEDISKTMKDLEKTLNMKIARPVLEMLDLLQDAPYESGLPPTEKTKKCKPYCTDAIHSQCILGYNPKDEVYDISNFIINSNKWKYENVAGNPQPLSNMDGGQASLDTKFGWKGNKDSGELVIKIQIQNNNILLVEKPYADWGGLNDVIKKMANWFKVKIIDIDDIIITNEKDQKNSEDIKKKQIGRELKCNTKDKSLWMNDINNFGCAIKFDYGGKYTLAFTVDTKDDIPICVITAF